jgi:hypothetical protein
MYRSLQWYIEGGGKSTYCTVGNFCLQTFMGAMGLPFVFSNYAADELVFFGLRTVNVNIILLECDAV